jgi:FAD/FMN-containing dehydrogenase/pimeloyl-ACP methyl ester carboxylesterase
MKGQPEIQDAKPLAGGLAARERLLAGIAVEERRVELAGVSTAVLEGGAGPPAVLLHGPAANATHWLDVLPGLATTNLVIAPDLPGQGASQVSEGPLTPDRVIAWLGELIENTCASPPALVGYALGGAVAARFAADRGDLLDRLVLVDTLGLAPFAPPPDFGLAVNAFLAGPGTSTHEGLWRHCALDLDALRERMGSRWEAFEAYNIDRARAPAVAASLGMLLEEFGGPPIPPADLERIAVPTSLIWGRHDLATPLRIAEAAGARHGWPLQVIEDAADDTPVEQPEAFLAALRAALGATRDGALAPHAQTDEGKKMTVTDSGALEIAGFAGELVGPADPRYDELRRVFNGMIDRRPQLIARCANALDVSAAIGFARERGLGVSVYGGGHNVTGSAVCDGGVTIDLRPMKDIEIDPEARSCRAAGGLTWGELDAATQRHGLAVTGGRMSTTGLGGLALGGGSGWIERKCGYTVDNLLSVEIVTAGGEVVRASESEYPELFWGTRGGGGNFGVVTSFELQLHPIGPTVLAGMVLYPAEMAAGVLRNFRDVMADAPDEVGSGVALLTAPPEEFVPEPVRGQPICGVILCYAGPFDEGEQALRPLREFGPPAVDMVQPMPYVAAQQLVDAGYPSGMRNYWTGDFLSGLPDDAIDVMCRYHLTKPSPLTQILTLPGGGASASVPDGTMAISHRDAPFNIHITSLWPDSAGDAANIAWTRELSAAMKPYTTGRVYLNFLGEEGQDRILASFGRDGYARLQALKDRWDPDNLFSSNQNITPTRAAAGAVPAGARA